MSWESTGKRPNERAEAEYYGYNYTFTDYRRNRLTATEKVGAFTPWFPGFRFGMTGTEFSEAFWNWRAEEKERQLHEEAGKEWYETMEGR